MDEEVVKLIGENKCLYRGTTNKGFELRKTNRTYFGRRSSGELITCTTLSLLYAMVSGGQRCLTDYSRERDVHPLLLAIDPSNYRDNVRLGLEYLAPGSTSNEIEIVGEIDFKDIVVVDSLDKLHKVHPNLDGSEIDYFRRKYLLEMPV